MAKLTYVGHATLLIEMDGVRLLTDPVLRDRVGPLRRQARTPNLSGWKNVDAVLISHLHWDHLDLPSLRMLGTRTRLVVPRGAGDYLNQRGFRRVSEIENGEKMRVGRVTIKATPANHSGFRPPFGPIVNSLGYLIQGSCNFYFPGDTDMFPEMAQIGPGIDVALLPVWGWGFRAANGHLDPHQAARALPMLQPRLAVPIHWGTFYPVGMSRIHNGFRSDPPHAFVRYAAEVAPDVKVQVLHPGQSLYPAISMIA